MVNARGAAYALLEKVRSLFCPSRDAMCGAFPERIASNNAPAGAVQAKMMTRARP